MSDDNDDKQRLRDVPASELDLQLMLTNTKYGEAGVSEELKRVLGNTEITTIDGREYIRVGSLWGLLGYYTRDLRLGNISQYGGEVNYCQEYIDFAGDALRGVSVTTKDRRRKNISFVNAFMCAFSRAITLIEISQSRGGFLRKRLSTLTSENIQSNLEPAKKGLFNKGGEGER